ncbi:MAG: calcineurin-like phosphoesterase family protein [Alistipes sp.]|nr:calcineurin-like phosphoesterase family protein [Alistipes sp.]
MKNIASILALLAALLVGCQTDKVLDNTVEKAETVLSISLAQTRTSLGEKQGDTYPAYWSAGDRIVVNGVESEEAVIDAADASNARFVLGKSLDYPYYITYPFTPSTTAETPIVEFPAEQNYVDGTFATGSAPMCGYMESGKEASLSHLAAILRFSVKAKSGDAILKKIVITSTSGAKIAGEFAVDCKNATIVPTEATQSFITYMLPDNFSLSTAQTSDLYISLAAVATGKCTIEFVEASGKKMTAIWNPSKPLSKGVIREFKSIVYAPNTAVELQPLVAEEDELSIFYQNISGHVRYSDGTPISGVAISDGFRIVTTDESGYYELNDVTRETWYIYCSLPADVEISVNEFGQPDFFKKYPSGTAQYDFTFNKLAGGKEKKFAIFALADTQPTTLKLIERFRVQTAPEVKDYAQSLGLPCYGVVLGDLVGSVPSLMEPMRDELAANKVGMPMFPVMGNHDHIAYSELNPVFADERNRGYNIKIQRGFEECFGPVNFSFNRGDVHIVGMRNLQHKDNTHVANYVRGFSAEQFEWLKQDLALVPKDKMVILCVHIPMLNYGKVGDGSYCQEVLNLLDEYAEAHIFSGHTHYMRPYDHVWYKTGHKIYEHCIAATRPDMFDANIHRDGTPCGYAVHHIDGNSMVDWYYKGCVYGMNSRDQQIRIYRGNAITGAAVSGTDKYGTMGYYQFPYADDMILANIFSSDPGWDVEVYEDGDYGGKMTHFTNISGSDFDALQGDGSYENPRRVADGLECSRDWWAIGILLGRLGSEANNNYNTCHTMWKYTLKNPNAKVIEVRATDRFGRTYKESKIQDGLEVGYEMYDPQYNPVID